MGISKKTKTLSMKASGTHYSPLSSVQYVHYCNGTIPCMAEGMGETMYYIPYKFDSFIGPEKWWDNEEHLERLALFVKDYWTSTVWIAICYAMGVHLLQRIMAERDAMELKGPLIIWNAFLAVFSIIGTLRMGEELLHVLRTYPLLDSISYTLDPEQPAACWALLFTFSKILELGDTVFLVLRKKPLIFLHWYHHAVVLVSAFHTLREGAALGRWYATMNYFVHSIMYSYFAFSAAGFRFPKGLSMAITAMQTLQMVMGLAICMIVFYFKLQGRIMQQSYQSCYICFGIAVSFVVLFSDFFKTSYIDEKKAKKKIQ